MKRIQTIFNIIFIVLILLIIQNAIAINSFRSQITELEIKISTLEYKNFELSEQIKKIKFRNAFWGGCKQ
ncbi:hypothetical protein [Brachyspira sp.]|uniref:hypothetical protein n=1 Tax=Brachyspira sp. TaxID=1977261 RepID=UPI003D7F0AEA